MAPLETEDLEKLVVEARSDDLGIHLPLCKRAIDETFSCNGEQISLKILNREDQFVGVVRLSAIDLQVGAGDVYAWIFEIHQGCGYAKEALRLLLRYAFCEMRLQRVGATVNELNEAGIALLDRIGFKREGRRERMLYTGGEYHDQLILGLLKEAFIAIKNNEVH